MNPATVFLVDDDPGVRESISLLLETSGLPVAGFGSAEDFLAAWKPEHHGCLLLDMRMPGMNGADLQAVLRQQGIAVPIIFLSAYGDVPTTVRAIKGGAVDFLTKPVNGAILLDRVKAALAANDAVRRAEALRRDMQDRLAKLTQREREILGLALAGKTNKEIALVLQISHRTIEAHRSRILLKTGVHSLLELAGLASEAGISLEPFSGGQVDT